MKLKFALALASALIAGHATYAQFNQDALRFSTGDRGGSARFKAIGNASTALGGDISSINGNPAGLGFFNTSEFSVTPDFNGSTMDATYFGQNNFDAARTKNRVNFNNASIVFNAPQRIYGGDPTKGLLTVNYGIGWNRTNTYNDNLQFSGFNPTSSIADMYAQRANTDGPTVSALRDAYNPVGFWGYSHYLVDSVGRDNFGNLYQAATKLNAGQTLTQVMSGGQNELNMAIGANYSNKLYLGASIGFASLRYKSNSEFAEEGEDTRFNQGYRNYFDQWQETTGSGFNFKVGMIYRPTPAFQLGASFTSPTWYSISDNYTVGMETFYANGEEYKGTPETFDSNYNLRTPLKVSGGIALMQKFGFISADVEYVDYSNIKLSGYEGSNQDNQVIGDLYRGAVNARLGAEGRVNNNVYLRAGYSYLGNPEKGIGSATNIISGGLGYRVSKFYVDATYSHMTRDMVVYPYEIASNSPSADVTRKLNNVYLTVGFKF